MKRSALPSCLFLAALFLVGQAHAQSGDGDHGSWWWSWADGSFGLNLGGVTYGNGQDRVVGSDHLVHQPRTIAAVRGVELRGPVNVVLKQAPAEKLTLHTDDNLTALIETTVQDGILRIGIKEGASFRSKHPIGATLELPRLESIHLLASGDLTCAGFDAEMLRITIEGSGNVRLDALRTGTIAVLVKGSGSVHLSGTAAQQGYVIEGSGNIDAAELAGRSVAVRVAGSGNADVWTTGALSVDIQGSGNVLYRGKPAIAKSISGSGELIAH